MLDAVVVLVGLLIGLLVGSTGVGAGTLGALFLIFALQVDPLDAVGTDLFINAVIRVTSSIVHNCANKSIARRPYLWRFPLSRATCWGSRCWL